VEAKMKLVYPAVFYPDDESTAWSVEVPDLPGCISCGATLYEAIEMGVDAASGWILGEIEEGLPVPPPSPIEAIKPDEGENGFVSLLTLNITEYGKKYGQQLTKAEIEVELPAYLVTFAKDQQINLSDAVQSHLTKKFREYHEMDEREKDLKAIEAEEAAKPAAAS
jgi:predicted RNase H-like HicB family nuclease/post-segregation antitoxin (ccd killing protein)